MEGKWLAKVDADRRGEIERHHSCTHLIHAALRNILGDHVAQKGSLVDDHHLRFDFSHFEAVSKDQLDEIESIVNSKIRENIPLVEERDVPIDQARERGAMMLFGEKYGEKVRMITFDPEYSVELCGGTHVKATGEIGYFRFTQETSVAAGIRRIEGVTGRHADEYLREEKHALAEVKEIVGHSDHLADFIKKLLNEKKVLEKELEKLNMAQSGDQLSDLIKAAEVISDDIKLIKGEISGADMSTLKQLGYDSLNAIKEKCVTVLGSRDEEEGKVYLMVSITDDLVNTTNLKAGVIVGKLGKLVGGGGGGQPTLATAGGRLPEKLESALNETASIIEDLQA
jgi:alanyl-tRNA synthetase